VIARGIEESQGNYQWDEESSKRQLTDGKGWKTVTARKDKESQDNDPLMKNNICMIARENKELGA
jgi:hypothetical protein